MINTLHQASGLLRQYLKPQARRMIWLAIVMLAGIGLGLAGPQVIRYFLDEVTTGSPLRVLLWAAVLYLAFAFLQRGFELLSIYLAAITGWQATNTLRYDLALHCLRLDLPFHKTHTPGELIERIDGDVTALTNFFSTFIIELLGNLLLITGILALLFIESPLLGLSLLGYTVAVLAIFGSVQTRAQRAWTEARQVVAEQYGYIEERISGAEDVRAIGGERHMINRLFPLMRAYLYKVRHSHMWGAFLNGLTSLMGAGGNLLGLGLGVYLYTRGEATIGTAYLIVQYVGMLSDPLQKLRRQVEDFQQASASVQRVGELFAQQPARSKVFSSQDSSLPEGALSVQFEEVSFAYEPAEPLALDKVSFQLQPGKVMGVIGRTGSGKTTLARLLLGLYEPVTGAIALNGQDLRGLPLDELRHRVGMVTQDVQLFHASIRNNLTFFNPAISDETIAAALKELHLLDWAQSLPHGLDTVLAASGEGLSAGEAQLLAFTRVYLKDPGLLILDEASSRMDPATEARLEGALDRLFAGRTAIMIAHRLGTILRADEILILENGCVVEFGPRQELQANPRSKFSELLRTGLEEALA